MKEVNGYLWPDADRECAGAIFQQLPEALNQVYQRVRQYRIALQAGGNCGLWPVELAKRFERVYTWEPHPQNFHALRNNLKRFHARNVTAFNAALAESSRELQRAVMQGDDANCGAYQVQTTDKLQDGAPFMSIDSLELRANVDLIYLDIEGYELQALEGARETILTCKPLIILEQKGLGGSEEQILPLLAQYGYEMTHEFARDKVYECNASSLSVNTAGQEPSSAVEEPKASTTKSPKRSRWSGVSGKSRFSP